jgi:hypothetical protein
VKNAATSDLMAWGGGWLVNGSSSTKNIFSIYFDHFNTVFKAQAAYCRGTWRFAEPYRREPMAAGPAAVVRGE